jgi:hypothetical protein
MGAKLGVERFGTGVMGFEGAKSGVEFVAGPGVGVGALGVGALGVGAGAGMDLGGAGVEGGSMAGFSGFGFGFIFVIKNDSLAPVPLGSHSIKLYDGK